MTAWTRDHKRPSTRTGPSLAEQIENGIAFAGMAACLIMAVCALLMGWGLI